jgi:hypothetical protein
VGEAVDDQPARPADALAAVAVERDRTLPLRGEPFVQHVERVEQRHVRRQPVETEGLEAAAGRGAVLPPHAQRELHR